MNSLITITMLISSCLLAYGQADSAPPFVPIIIDGYGIGDLNVNIIQFERHGTITVIGPTQTGQPGTSTTTYGSVSAGRQLAADAVGIAAGVGIAFGVSAGTTAVERAIVKHQGPDKNYKEAVKHCGQRYIAHVGAFNVHAAEMKAVLEQCKIDAAKEFPAR
jgi:hypothetical protein